MFGIVAEVSSLKTFCSSSLSGRIYFAKHVTMEEARTPKLHQTLCQERVSCFSVLCVVSWHSLMYSFKSK